MIVFDTSNLYKCEQTSKIKNTRVEYSGNPSLRNKLLRFAIARPHQQQPLPSRPFIRLHITTNHHPSHSIARTPTYPPSKHGIIQRPNNYANALRTSNHQLFLALQSCLPQQDFRSHLRRFTYISKCRVPFSFGGKPQCQASQQSQDQE